MRATTSNSISTSRVRRAFMMMAILMAILVISPDVQAVSPPPDGGYGGQNTAEGTDALFNLTTGVWNSAFGFRALYKNASSIRNTAVGYQALYNNNGWFNVNGQDNIGIGPNALFNNTTGNRNIAIGSFALNDNVTGSDNVAIGNHALWHFTGSGSTQIGDSFASGRDFVSIGRLPTYDHGGNLTDHGVLSAYMNAENDIYIGSGVQAVPEITFTSRVHIEAQDAVYVGAVYGNAIAGSPVVIAANGQLGVAPSSRRFKKEIKPMQQSSETLLALKPVTFRYKPDIDRNSSQQFGLVAEDVEKVNPDLIVRDKQGKPYTVRYDAVNAMLLNEFLKEHRTVEQLKTNAAEQEKEVRALAAIVKEQASQLEKVNARLEASESIPQVVGAQ